VVVVVKRPTLHCAAALHCNVQICWDVLMMLMRNDNKL
jgi:hypothetical protein